MRIEIYDAGLYIDVECDSLDEAREEMMKRGNKAHEKLLQKSTPDLRVVMTKNEYAIVGRHQTLWFSARVVE